jgi:uncharacterized protein YbjQ (UPF0145 family)
MLLSTMNDLPGYEVPEILGEVFGITVRSRHVGPRPGQATAKRCDGNPRSRGP